jgi:hypothetical protein
MKHKMDLLELREEFENRREDNLLFTISIIFSRAICAVSPRHLFATTYNEKK